MAGYRFRPRFALYLYMSVVEDSLTPATADVDAALPLANLPSLVDFQFLPGLVHG